MRYYNFLEIPFLCKYGLEQILILKFQRSKLDIVVKKKYLLYVVEHLRLCYVFVSQGKIVHTFLILGKVKIAGRKDGGKMNCDDARKCS